MEKARFETKQEYIEYCIKHNVFNERRKYCSTRTLFDDSLELNGREIYISDTEYIDDEPKSYPAILIYEFDGDNFYGSFVYPKDLE
jgi:hypothetical protein